MYFNVSYTKKEDVSDDDLLNVFSDFKKENGGQCSDDDILKITITANNYAYTPSGEVSYDYPVYAYAWYSPTSDEQIALFDPDIAEIAYADETKIYPAYYDFKNDKIKFDYKKAIDKYTWSDSEFAKSVPAPEYDIVRVNMDSKRRFSFSINGVYIEDFENYVSECVSCGYEQNNDKSNETYFVGKNADGMELSLSFSESSNEIRGGIDMAD